MDRLRANRNIRSGLLIAAFAVFVFGLSFYAAILYVA
jgi:hypothetical protein